MPLSVHFPSLWGVGLVLFVTCAFAFVQTSKSLGISPALAAAIEDELQAHVRRMELRADEMHVRHRRNIARIKEEHAHTRSKRNAYTIQDLRHGFVPGSGVGNRESVYITDIIPINSSELMHQPIAGWDAFVIGKKQFLVASSVDQGVDIFQFNASRTDDPLIIVHSQNIKSRAMTTFSQKYYSGSTSSETKIVLASSNETVIVVANSDGSSFQEQQQVTVHPTNVTDVEFFTIGIESYLAFSRDTGDASGLGEQSSIYLWSATMSMFDIRQRIRTYGARQVQSFEILRKMYLLTVENTNSSTIWRYNSRQAQFRVYQQIENVGASFGLYFTQSHESYIIFISADGDRSSFYHWDGFYFHIVQNLHTPSALSWSIVREPSTCQDVPLLTLSSHLPWPRSIAIYSVSDSLLVRSDFPGSHRVPRQGILGVQSVLQFSDWRDTMYIAVVFSMRGPAGLVTRLYQLACEVVPVDSPYAAVIQDAFEAAFNNVQENLDVYERRVIDGTKKLEDSVTLTDGKLEISGNVTFNGSIIFNGTVEVETLEADEIIVDNSIVWIPPCPVGWTTRDSSCYIFESAPTNWDAAEADCVSKSGHLISFDTLDEFTFFTEFVLARTGGRVWTGLNDKSIEGTWVFPDLGPASPEILASVWSPGEPNDYESGEDCTIWPYGNGVNDMRCSASYGRVCEIEQSAESSTLGDALDELEAKATENQGTSATLRTLFDDRVTLSEAESITAHKTFKSLTIDGELQANSLTAATVNGINVDALDGAALRNNLPGQTLAGKLTFSDDVVADNVGLQNGIMVNGFDMGDAVTETGAQTISGAKTFTRDLSITGNAVFQAAVTLNTVDVSEEVVTLSGDHQLDASITFSSTITVNGDITTSSTVDTIDVSDLDTNTVREADGKTVTGPVTFSNQVTVDGDVAIGATANSIDLSDFDSRAVKHNVDTTISGGKTFSGDITVDGSIHPGSYVDGVDLFVDSLLINSTNSSLIQATSYIPGLLFPYGEAENDQIIPPNDDSQAAEVVLSQAFPFFNNMESLLYVNPNGLLSFLQPVSVYTPTPFPLGDDQRYIVPFWADVDTRVGGTIYYRQELRETKEQPAFQEADRVVCNSFRIHFSSTWMFVATWHEVAYFGATGPARNTFQAVIVSDGRLSFALFNFEDIEWTTGTESNGDPATGLGGTPALVGFNAGDGVVYYQVSPSNAADVVDIDDTTNIGIPGRWLFQTNNLHIDGLEFSGQTVTAAKSFSNCLTVEGSMQVDGTVDGVFLRNAVTLTGTSTIVAGKTFTTGPTLQSDLHITGEIDGVDVSDIATKVMTLSSRNPQTVQGDVTFNNLFTSNDDVNVGGTVNDVDIAALAADTVYSNVATEQFISAAKTFTQGVDVTSGSLKFTGLVNTHDVTNDFLDLSSSQTVLGSKTFTDGFAASGDLTVGGTVDGVTVESLWTAAALTTRDETVGGNKDFAGDMSVSAPLTVAGDTNTIDLSDDVMMLAGQQTVTGAKTFSEIKATVNVQATDGNIANLNSEDWSAFVNGRVTLSTVQTVTGGVTFSDQLSIGGDIDTDDLINGVDLPAFADSILYITGDETVSGAKTFTDTVTVSGPATLDGSLDDVDIDDMKARAIYLDKGVQTISQKKTFLDDVTVQSDMTITELLSYVDLAFMNADIVWTNDGAQTIAAKKEFEDGFTASQSVSISGTINNIDISEEVLLLIDAQDITGSYTFNDDVTIDEDLNVDGDINGVDIVALDSDAMKVDETQGVSSYIEFDDDVAVAGDITVQDTETVDTVDLSALKDIAKFVDEPFTLPNPVTFDLPVTFSGGLDVSGTVHGIDFQAWASRVLNKDTMQTITGAHTIEGTVQGDVDVGVMGDIDADTAYGFDLNEFFGDVVKLQGDKVITGFKTFKDDVAVQGIITVTGTVDGVDISEDVVTLSAAETISGAKTFDTCDVHTSGQISVTEYVNGVEISNEHADTLDFRRPSKVDGTKTFTRDTRVNGDLQVNGYVDGKDIAHGVTLGTEQTITAYHIFNSKASVDGSITVGGLVQTVDLDNINRKRVTLSGSNTVEGSLMFTDRATFQADVATEYLFDGADLSALSALEESRHDEYANDIYDLACFAETQCERTESITEVVNNFIDAIDYLEEFQGIQEHVQTFKSFAIDGVTFLAAAVYSNDHGDVCTTSVIYRWNTTIGLFDELQRINTNGAVTWQHFTIDDEAYVIVANSGHIACHGTPSGNAIYKYNTGTFSLISEVGEEVDATSDIAFLTVDDMHFLVFTTSDGSIATVYEYNENSGDFEVFQDISTGVTSSVESLQIGDKIFLIFTLYLMEASAVYVFDPAQQIFVLFQEVMSEHAREVTGFHYDNVHGFALAEHWSVSDVDITSDVQIRVFMWNDATEEFELTYSVPVVQPGDVDIFSEGNFLYMSVVQEHHSVDLYRYEGSAGFVQFYHVPHHGARSVERINLQESEYEAGTGVEVNQMLMAVAVDPFPKHDVYSRLLKVINIGGSVQVKTWENMCDSGLKTTTRDDTPEPTC